MMKKVARSEQEIYSDVHKESKVSLVTSSPLSNKYSNPLFIDDCPGRAIKK